MARKEDAKVLRLWCEKNYYLTLNPNEALFILNDGAFLDGIFECGVRGEDHHGMLSFFDGMNIPESQQWRTLHLKYGVIRLVPETGEALVAKGQRLSRYQKNVIKKLGLKREAYC